MNQVEVHGAIIRVFDSFFLQTSHAIPICALHGAMHGLTKSWFISCDNDISNVCVYPGDSELMEQAVQHGFSITHLESLFISMGIRCMHLRNTRKYSALCFCYVLFLRYSFSHNAVHTSIQIACFRDMHRKQNSMCAQGITDHQYEWE